MSYDIEAYNNAVSEWVIKKLDDDTSNDGTPYPRMSDYFDATYGPWFEVIYYGQFVRTQSSPTTVAIAPGTYAPRVPLPVTW
ncbi:hypothetical protein [Chitinophaga sp. sic0106]|uniref:hypothetical protein n=1 Tax=Chitinophaga sp. sic0106 TaxID=2854785 RepID=UPI001C46225A|nr:hypothetical protein [Chitinophaga sp. sic0106]MBV7529895.1 hypothetical protein [Chitinophaga sp. sic0106]